MEKEKFTDKIQFFASLTQQDKPQDPPQEKKPTMLGFVKERRKTMSADDKRKTFEKLNEQLKCAICLNRYNDPRVLPCLHSFCRSCLTAMASVQSSIVSWKTDHEYIK
jgi:hypothetical protein